MLTKDEENYLAKIDPTQKVTVLPFNPKAKNIDVPIQLNEESIGYDWISLEKVKNVMKHEDEKKAFYLI